MAKDIREPAETVNANRAYQNAWIVYINGLEVPVVSADVTCGVWKIPQAEIVMMPDPSLQRLGAEDRVAVQVFYCDQWLNPGKPEFRLMFDGEIIGWNYINVDRGRNISFTCVDYIQIFTQLFFFLMSGIDDMAIGASAEQIGISVNTVNVAGLGCLFPYSLFAQGLVSPQGAGTNAPLIKRPVDYVYNVVRGFMQDVPLRSVPACNFFAPWARRTGFDRRFMAMPYLEEDPEATGDSGIFPILRSVQADFGVAAVAKMSSQIGSAGSIWQVFEQILSMLMMELAMIPTPMAIQSSNELHSYGLAKARHTNKNPVHLANYFVKPQLLFGLPPACNVFFPSQITSFSYQENYATQPTRMYFSDDSWLTYINQQTSDSALQAVMRNALSVAHPEEVNAVMQDSLKNPGENGKNMLVYPEEFFRGPVVDKRSMPRWFTFLKEAQQKNISDTVSGTADQKLKSAQDVLPGDGTRNLYRKYAAYEFSKEKYARRNAGLHMPFNPYPVPGFPCAVFDQRHTQLDVFGYIMNIKHSLTSRTMTTDIGISYGRTMKEAFSLLHRQIETENAILNRDKAEVRAAIADAAFDVRQAIVQDMERVGAIAIAPAEPIREIRDRTQNFIRAEDFYRALFHGFVDPATKKSAPSTEQAELNRQTPEANADNYSRADKNTSTLADAPTVETGPLPSDNAGIELTSRADANGNELLESVPEDKPVKVIADDSVAQIPWSTGAETRKTAVFRYDQVIQFVSAKGVEERLSMEGMDGTTRIALRKIISKMREGTATVDEVVELNKALLSPIDLNQDFANPDDELLATLVLEDEYIQNIVTTSNIRGGSDIEIAPTPEAASLFTNFEAAMRYNARPICTLDNYLEFLDLNVEPEGIHTPNSALAGQQSRAFPATYYERIRTFRAGPPTTLPPTNMSNSSFMTSPDGLWVIPLGSQSLTIAEIKAAADAREQTNTPQAVANTMMSGPTVVATVPTISAIADDFPETSINWDIVLAAYRRNVLTRLSPGR